MNARSEVRPIDDLRSYIDALEAHGQLHRVKTEVDWKFELCHVSKVNEEQKGPALLYENVKGYDIPVFTSAFTTLAAPGHRARAGPVAVDVPAVEEVDGADDQADGQAGARRPTRR